MFFPQKEYTQSRGFYQTMQIVSLISMFVDTEQFAMRVVMNEASLLAPVSTVALDLSQALNLVLGCLPNTHHHPRQHAEEPHRLLLNPRERDAVCE
jgi:hypothetical protein